jgi:single-strand DNA-binding protein
MQSIFITGNLGKDSEIRQAGNDDVLSFSVGVKQGYGDRASSNWFRCSIWGKRGANLKQYLLKGVKVAVHGELTIGEYQGKPQFDVRVNEIDLMTRGERQQSEPQRSTGGGGGGFASDDLDDDVPFVTNGLTHEHRA